MLYVESLIGEQTVNTVPDATLLAFHDHGEAPPRWPPTRLARADAGPAWPPARWDLEAVGERPKWMVSSCLMRRLCRAAGADGVIRFAC